MPKAKRTARPTSRRRSAPNGGGASKTGRKNSAVDAWFDKSDHPLEPLKHRVRRVILASDRRVTESIKWSTPTFSFNGDIASFIPQAKSFVSLLFHRGAEIPGKHPRLEATPASPARFVLPTPTNSRSTPRTWSA